jgi:hypothetical protein
VAFTSPRWKPFFEDLERRGILGQLERWLSERIAADELKLRLLIRETLITDAEKLAQVHAMQGRLSAYAALKGAMRDLGKRPESATLRDASKSDSVSSG